VTYQHTDALGSPVAKTNTGRTVIQRSEYEPYGKLLNRPMENGPGYTGHVADADTGLIYMQQRYYDPGIGAFLSTDPVTALKGPFNRYWYANANPYKFKDPDGRVIKFADGSSPEFLRNVAAAIRYLDAKGAASPIAEAWRSEEVFTLQAASDRSDPGLTSYDPEFKTITWADKGGLEVRDFQSGEKGLLSPALALGHEFEHASNDVNGGDSYARDTNTYDSAYDNQEERNVIEEYERPAAERLGEGMRGDHSGRPVEFSCPTLDCAP
jgi:RHS repeat-associated protein